MLRLFSSKAQGCKDFSKPFKASHVGIHWIALKDEYPYARVSVIFLVFLHNFVLTKLGASSIRVKK